MTVFTSKVTDGCYEVYTSLLCKDGAYSYKSALYSEGEEIDNCVTPSVTDNLKTAEEIFDVLIRNKVFPCHVMNIIDDIL